MRQEQHSKVSPEAHTAKAKTSKISKGFWIIMLFFFISATAYYLQGFLLN